MGASSNGPVIAASLSRICSETVGGLAAPSNAKLPETAPEPSFPEIRSTRSVSSCSVTSADASRSTGRWPASTDPISTRRSPRQPCRMPSGSGTSEPASGSRTDTASAKTRPVKCGSSPPTSSARFPVARSDAAVRSKVSAAMRPGAAARCATSDSEPSPSHSGRPLIPARSARPSTATSLRAPGWCSVTAPAHSPERRSIVGRASSRASANASRTPTASASCGPSACTSSLAGPCQKAGVARQAFGSSIRQRRRIAGRQAEHAVAQPAALAEHAGRNDVRAVRRALDPAQQDAAGLDRGIHGEPVDRCAGPRRLPDVEAQLGIDAGGQTRQIGQAGRPHRQPGIQRQTIQRQIGFQRWRLAALEGDAARRSARHRWCRRSAAAKSRRRWSRTCADSAARWSTPSGTQAGRPGGSAHGIASPSHRSVVRRTGASSLASPSNRAWSGSARAMRPLRRSLPFPGSDALASRTTSSLPARLNASPHVFQRAAAQRRRLGREVEPDRHVDPGDRGAGAQQNRQPGIQIEPAGRQRDVEPLLRRHAQCHRAAGGRPADLECEIVDRREAAADRQPPVRAERHRRRGQQHRQVGTAAGDGAGERAVAAICPATLAPSPLALPWPSRVTFSPAAPSAPAAVSRAVKFQPRSPKRAVPEADNAPVSSVASLASMPVKASRPMVSRPFSTRTANAVSQAGGRARNIAGSAGQGIRRSGPAQHQFARIDTPGDQRPERDAQPQRIDMDRQVRGLAAADGHLGRGQHRLRQQRQRDRSLDGNRLAEGGRCEHLDRGAVAGPVEPLRNLPRGEQRQGT